MGIYYLWILTLVEVSRMSQAAGAGAIVLVSYPGINIGGSFIIDEDKAISGEFGTGGGP